MEEQEFESGEELLKTKQRERQIRKGQKKQSFLKSLTRFITGLGIISGIYYFSTLSGWYLPQDAFRTCPPSVIQIVNNKIAKTSKIKSTVKDIEVPQSPLFLANMQELREKLISLPPVDNVYIRRYAFPARILIIVQESTPVITISPDATVKPVAAFTKDAKLITGADYLPLPQEYKTILVLSYGNKGDDYTKWDLTKIKEIEKISKYVETFSREQVEYIDLRNPKDVYVKVQIAPIRLGHLDTGIYDRIKRIPSILPQVKQVKGKVKYIDLSWEKVNYLKME
ncbi:FtsQ-type POTRA domain-containing protein [bacterium]|nr:FtsQ-type POTRA domain-containing protein [bacterium]